MATWIKATGGIETVTPANGKEFTLAELQKMVGGYIEEFYLRNESGQPIMFLNEDGKRLELPPNLNATEIASENGLFVGDIVVGDVVITTRAEAGAQTEREDGEQ